MLLPDCFQNIFRLGSEIAAAVHGAWLKAGMSTSGHLLLCAFPALALQAKQ